MVSLYFTLINQLFPSQALPYHWVVHSTPLKRNSRICISLLFAPSQQGKKHNFLSGKINHDINLNFSKQVKTTFKEAHIMTHRNKKNWHDLAEFIQCSNQHVFGDFPITMNITATESLTCSNT